MDRIYLIIFLVLVGAFVHWYQRNILDKKYAVSSSKRKKKSKKHKKHKKNKKRKKRRRSKEYTPDTESVDSDSTNSRITQRKSRVSRAYKNNLGSELGTGTDDTISVDSLSMSSRESVSMGGDDISLDSVSSSDFLSIESSR